MPWFLKVKEVKIKDMAHGWTLNNTLQNKIKQKRKEDNKAKKKRRRNY